MLSCYNCNNDKCSHNHTSYIVIYSFLSLPPKPGLGCPLSSAWLQDPHLLYSFKGLKCRTEAPPSPITSFSGKNLLKTTGVKLMSSPQVTFTLLINTLQHTLSVSLLLFLEFRILWDESVYACRSFDDRGPWSVHRVLL